MKMKRKSIEKPRPLVALLTDFGNRDWFVASMKGVIKSIAPKTDIVDITHDIPRQHPASASFVLESCRSDFPEGTVFCSVVDPGVGTDRKRLVATDGLYFYIAPDNGLLTGIESRAETFLAWEIVNPEFMLEGKGATFEGRDVFAPAAAHLTAGVSPEQFGPLCKNIILLEPEIPGAAGKNKIRGRVVYIDAFGNLITNITPEDLPSKRNEKEWTVTIKRRRINGLKRGFEEADPGKLLVYTGSTGRLEIAANRANAAKILDARVGTTVTLTYR